MSVKIAFWSMEPSCHTRENMFLMASLLAKKKPEFSIVVQRDTGWKCIFEGGKERIIFADCGCGRDKKIQNSLRSADLVVVSVQSYQNEWENIRYDFKLKPKKVLYLIEGYALHAQHMRAEMEHTYRIASEQIGYVPQNSELEWASEQGHLENFAERWRRTSRSEQNNNFFGEMEHNLFLLIRQLEQKENGGYQLWNR